ncbi:MAG TPA: hypothetical protein DDX89_00640 [Candidatus Omnitrophica bacterium]|nr:MAG: hypothetical protein A2Z92_03910 [Omnitrophica WOR_2 bacterium GWA2_63_20]OGX16627.1 MAG: hypothetical protein A2105_01615 [Omnitrophica WOR_2 bacterium GWF2_63_9]OGX30835.1 MAG: hypothetical protein A3E56_01625 [Omnitrophica WOR_2 bacterium RIFCSPHIGHO2_12_FULL_64_13]OGX36532.1 MAG: hypothetical protein A3B73_03960 [Omnitrophica WOR_2 bacterium RIFCSPHIGHO2_02_FULL_63_39]OGX46254.1 MAG: hypothetical protein A3I71_07560 [Omnitrophica WOR_2 bacterium RIFCSPLOWO2_02_FULL_63_16]OGX47032.1
MDLEALWDKALKETEILRARLPDLATFEATTLPYIFLAESSVNAGDTVVRKGHVLVERPSLILPSAQFQGFEFEHEHHFNDETVLNFLLVRGVRFPSLRYRHEFSSLDLRESSLKDAITHYVDSLARGEDIHTGLVVGPEEVWQFSILILVAGLLVRSAEGDLKRLFEEWRKRQSS